MSTDAVIVLVLSIVAGVMIILLIIAEVMRAIERSRNAQLPADTSDTWHFWIPATGEEVFTEPTRPDRVYRFTLEGTYAFSFGLVFSHAGEADAFYHADYGGNYSSRYEGIRINGKELGRLSPASLFEDRFIHRYSFQLDGTGDRLVLQLHCPHSTGSSSQENALRFTLEELPAAIPTLRSLRQQEEDQRRQDEERQARAEARAARRVVRRRQQAEQELQALALQAAQAVEQSAQQECERVLRAKADELIRRVARESNVFDENFRERFVRKNRQLILTKIEPDLGRLWVQEHEQLFADPELVAFLKIHAPQVLEWFDRRVEMIQFAERLDLPAHFYDEVENRLAAGEKVSSEPLALRLYDLEREAGILAGHRSSYLKGNEAGWENLVSAADERLEAIRTEITRRKDFLKSRGLPTDSKPQPDQEHSHMDQFVGLWQEEQETLGKLNGDDDAIEQARVLYAQERAKLFDQDSQYT